MGCLLRGALAIGLAGLLGACGGADAARTLPPDSRAPVLYVALGDSTVEGIGASSEHHTYVSQIYERLRLVYPEASLVNLGVRGAKSGDVIEAQLPRALDLRPHLVTLSIGPNDITGRVRLGEYEANLETIFTALVRETGALIVANLLPDLAITPRFRGTPREQAVGKLTVEFNEVLKRKARAHGVVLVDLYEASREEVPNRPELLAEDGYHPSDAGYARWAELIWPSIAQRITVR